jgi:hypothetical protein
MAKRPKSEDELAAMEKDFGYDYPRYSGRLDLRPKSEMSRTIIDKIVMPKCREARSVQSAMFEKLRKVDELREVYISADEYDEEVKSADDRVPVNTIISNMFANAEIYKAFMMKVFCGSPEVHKYQGLGGARQLASASLHQRITSVQSRWFNDKLAFNAMFHSAFHYGRGPMALHWRRDVRAVPVTKKVSEVASRMLKELHGIDAQPGEVRRYFENNPIREGTELIPVDFYQAFFDPNVAPSRFRDSEFFGYTERMSVQKLISRETDPEQNLFNAKYAKALCGNGGMKSQFYSNDSQRGIGTDTEGIKATGGFLNKNAVDVVKFFVEIIPEEHGLSDYDKPQFWEFWIAGDEVVVKCRPCDEHHGGLPFIDASPNCDGQTAFPISHALVNIPLFNLINWKMKLHGDSCASIVNGKTLFDPNYIDEAYLRTSDVGGMIPVKDPSYENGGLSQYIHEFRTQDPTMNFVSDVGVLDRMGRDIIGLGDVVMGMMDSMPERPGQAGIQAATSGMFSRMASNALIMDEQAFQPLAWMRAWNNMQYLGMEVQVPLLGQYAAEIQKEFGIPPDQYALGVTSEMLDPNFDVIPISGANPGMKNPAGAQEILQVFLQNPEVLAALSGEYRIGDMFAHLMKESTGDDLTQFRMSPEQQRQQTATVMGDEELMAQRQAGNIVPMGATA